MGSPLRQISSRNLAFILLMDWKTLGKSWETLGQISTAELRQRVGLQPLPSPRRDEEPEPALITGPDRTD